MKMSATESELRRAATWLRGYGLDVAPSPLLVARLAVRRRVQAAALAGGGLTVLVLIVSQGWWIAGLKMSPDAYAVPMAGQIVAMLCLVVTTGLTRRRIARAERRLGATLAVRVADARRAGWPAIVGGLRLGVMAVAYGGSVAIGLTALLFGESGLGRGIAGVLLATVGAVIALTAAEVAAIMRRPALAEDEMSLRVDDAVRAADVKALTNPGLLASMVMSALIPGASLWPYPGWLMLGAVVIAVSLLLESVGEARAYVTSRSASSTGQTLHRHP